VLLACTAALPREKPKQALPRLVAEAQFVYVTSYDGPPWKGDILPEDRQAVADVQEALGKWGKYIVVYEPAKADLIFAVQRRGGEDVLAVYQNRPLSSVPLWRGMAQGGLDSHEMPLLTDFRKAVEKSAAAK
jgi:hypothetical protein